MRYILFTIFWASCVLASQGQGTITVPEGAVQVRMDDKGGYRVDVPPNLARKFIARGWVGYGDFGARGDGQTDDIDAIAATHAFANDRGLSVRADDGATYYIGGKPRTAIIQTDTDFGTASFIIDDTDVERIGAAVFRVTS